MRSPSGPDRGRLDWRRPCRETLRQILLHPMYAGAYRYGHRPTDPRRQTAGHPKSGRGPGLSPEACLVFLKDRFPAYITWARYEANQERLVANRSRSESPGAVRNGAALLAGVVRCGRCGKRMYVRYGRTGQGPAYVCSTGRSDYAQPLCQSTSAGEVEGWVSEQILAALQPAALEASLTAAAAVEEQRQQLTRHWEQRIERAKYEADRAGRQYRACEPENRLVARTLERQWDELLREVARLEDEFDRVRRTQPRALGDADREAVRRLAEQVPAVWHAPTTTPADRRQIVRLLIDRVVLTVESTDDQVGVRVEWSGGAVREQTIRRAVRGYKQLRDWPQLSARLTALHGQDRTPDQIATALNGERFTPPKRASAFTAGMVRRLLDELKLRPRVSRGAGADGVLMDGEWWLHELARHLGASPHTLHGWRKKGWIEARQLGGRGGPWAVWAGGAELTRLGELKSCPRVWANRARLSQLRKPSPRG